MSCSKEEIEQKRLAALKKRQQNTYSESPFKSDLINHSNLNKQSSSSNITGKYQNTNFHKAFHPYSKSNSSSPTKNVVPVGKIVTGTIYLISEERFEVNPSEFCAPLINVFKSLPSKSYDPNTKLWNFSVTDYKELMSKVSLLAPHIVLGALPNFVLKTITENVIDPNSVDLSTIEATIRNKLMPFQVEGVRFGISKRGRCMIADDMGLGKTFQALAIASYYKQNWPLLIVTTSSMRETWQSKIHELLPSIPMMNIVSLLTNKDTQMVADRQTQVVICSFKLTSMHTQLLKDKKFGIIVVDESHHLKSSKAQCTVALTHIAREASRVVLLSGTPALSRPAELYTQLDLIHRNYFNGYIEYGKRYCAGKLSNFGWDMNGQSNLTELQIILNKKFLIRRTKEQVLTDMEDKTREAVHLDQSLLQFSSADRVGLSQMADDCRRSSADRHAALLSFFSESARVKIPAICKYLKQLVQEETTSKFLVFAHHKIMIDAICFTLDELNLHYISIVGSTPAHIRATLVDKFQHGSCRGAILSTTAAHCGLTLTAADLVIFAELHWNPGILTQAEARAHRLGQTRRVRVRYLLAAGTVDDHVWPMLQGKMDVLKEVGLTKDTFENTRSTLQETKNNITQYLSPKRNSANYVPGTNIRIGENINSDKSDSVKSDICDSENVDKSFMDDDDDDALLANLEL